MKFKNCKPGMVVKCNATKNVGVIVRCTEEIDGWHTNPHRTANKYISVCLNPKNKGHLVRMLPENVKSCHSRFVTGVSYKDKAGRIWEFTGAYLVSPYADPYAIGRTPGKAKPVKMEQISIIGMGTPERAGYTPVLR